MTGGRDRADPANLEEAEAELEVRDSASPEDPEVAEALENELDSLRGLVARLASERETVIPKEPVQPTVSPAELARILGAAQEELDSLKAKLDQLRIGIEQAPGEQSEPLRGELDATQHELYLTHAELTIARMEREEAQRLRTDSLKRQVDLEKELATLREQKTDLENQLIASAAGHGSTSLELGDLATRFKLTLNIGPSATIADLAQVLADLNVLVALSSEWADLEAQLEAGQGADPSSGGEPTALRGASQFSGDDLRIESFTYRNPVEVIVAASGGLTAVVTAFAGLAKVIRDWRIESQRAEAEIMRIGAETRKLGVEAAQAELDLFSQLRKLVDETDSQTSAELLQQLVGSHPGAVDSMKRLASYDLTIEQLPTPVNRPSAD